jgi:sirohydrochlorin ferrochelatase
MPSPLGSSVKSGLPFVVNYGKHAMSDITPELVADELKHALLPVPLAARPILLEAIANLVSKHVAAETNRCRTLCQQRAELWRNTEGGKSPLAQEARSRANEATYLADLLHL